MKSQTKYVFYIISIIFCIIIIFIIYYLFSVRALSGFTQVYFVDYNNFYQPILNFSFVVESQETFDFNYTYKLFFNDKLVKEDIFYLKSGEKKEFLEKIDLTKHDLKFPLKVTVVIDKVLQGDKEKDTPRKIWFWVFK